MGLLYQLFFNIQMQFFLEFVIPVGNHLDAPLNRIKAAGIGSYFVDIAGRIGPFWRGQSMWSESMGSVSLILRFAIFRKLSVPTPEEQPAVGLIARIRGGRHTAGPLRENADKGR